MGDGRIQDAMTDTTSGAQAAGQMQQSAPQGDWESAAATPAAQPPAQAQPPGQAQAPTQTQPATPAQPAAAPVGPIVLEKQHSPLGRVVESVLDSLTGTTRPVMATDAQGNKYVQQQTLTGAEKWERVAGELLSGAAKGLAAGKGAGNFGKAAAAGVDEGTKIAQQRKQETPQLTDEAQKENLANANYQMLRMNMIEQTWKAARLKTEATQHDIDFAQGQEARLTKPVSEGGPGGVRLGHAEHPADIARILKADPNVVENMIKNHQIEPLPYYNEDGTPGGNVYIKMPEGYRTTMLPAGSTFHTFDSSTGQYVEHKASDPMTAGERDDYETAAGVKAQKFKNDQTEMDLKTQQAAEAKANATKVPSEIAKNRAEANKAGAEAAKTKSDTVDDTLVDSVGMGKVTADRLGYLLARNPALLSAVTAKYPDFDGTKAASYGPLYKDFTSGKTSVALNSGATALGHLKELRDMNTVASHFPGTPAYNAYQNKVDTVAPELAKFYGDATIPAINALKSTLAANLPGGRQAAIATQVKSMGDKLDNYEQTWKNGAPSAVYEAPMPGISPKAQEARAALDPAYRARLVQQGSSGTNQPAAPASQRPQPPAGVPATYLFVKTTPQDPGQWIDPAKLNDAKKLAPSLVVVP
jgi:hypothetical protein